jgi:Rrf2 family transcriptional regulator, cysteine metabolism repressor
MRLTTKSEYALLALIHLARQPAGDNVSAEAIANAQAIPQSYLEQILRTLRQARFVASAKGQHGGFRLLKPASQVSIASVVRLFDGALAPTQSVSEYFYESTPIQKEPKVLGVLKDIRDYAARTLERTTLADVI